MQDKSALLVSAYVGRVMENRGGIQFDEVVAGLLPQGEPIGLEIKLAATIGELDLDTYPLYEPAYGSTAAAIASAARASHVDSNMYDTSDDEDSDALNPPPAIASNAFLEYYDKGRIPKAEFYDKYGGCPITFWKSRKEIPGQAALAEMAIDFCVGIQERSRSGML